MGKRVSYPISVKEEDVQMRLAGEIMDKLGMKNRTQVKTWMKWHRADNHYNSDCRKNGQGVY
ncbi:hypothetical protein [Bacillus aerius]|uniref:hypothetical protein n=1 Tax=Bacillus aerius TaxID=293388 RepID=UPI0035944AF6